MRRRTLLLATTLALPAIHARAQGAPYPNRPIRMIIPWPPGQATDLMGRVAGQLITDALGQPVVSENRPGAGGMIGTDAAAKSTPDGYTLLAASSGPVTINPLLQRVPFDPEKDLTSVAILGLSPYLLVVRPGFPATDMASFIAALKAAPGRYTFATSGTGATAHLISEYFNRGAGVEAVHVPFAGSGPALTSVLGGQVDYAIDTVAATGPLVRQGAVRTFGMSLTRPSVLAPGVPTIAEAAGIPGFNASAWLGVMAPGATPRPVIDRLSDAIKRGMANPTTQERLVAMGIEPEFRDTAAMAAHLRDQREVFSTIIRTAGIRLE
ncbi:Bug family tripartite tricarboxylate transporter substrate binding protein [Humitalea sp. 24SJ18S-53]|uniref:Bug family tripartite tricarboxylate transporter substrate binding protein n=1 Tax=Humitalea sp. 24SJ18S-53 TaxID=3422307 RepID=UPI003D66E129